MIYEPDVAQNPDTGGGVQSAKEGSQQPPLVTCGDSCAQKLSTKMHRNTNSEQFGKKCTVIQILDSLEKCIGTQI